MTVTATSQPISSPRSGRTSACANAGARGRSCSSRSSAAASGATRSSAAAPRLVELRRGRGARRAGRRLPRLRLRRASSSRPCRCPATGPALPESRFVVADDARALRPRARHRGGVLGDPARSRRGSRAAAGASARRRRARAAAPLPRRGEHERRVERGEGAHPRGRRVPGRALAARRAADVRVGARALPRAAPRQPVALSLPARARRARARRLLARDAS